MEVKEEIISENIEKKSSAKVAVDEIDFMEIVKSLWKNKFFLLKASIIAGLIGLLFSYISTVEYEVKVTLLPEVTAAKGSGMLGQFSGLAALGGFNFDGISNTEALRPDLYPEIIQSLNFGFFLINEEVFNEKSGKKVLMSTFIKENPSTQFKLKNYTIGLPSIIFKKDRNSDQRNAFYEEYSAINISKEERKLIEEVQKRIVSTIDKKTGIISLYVKMPDPYVAAIVANKTLEYLTKYITFYRVEKSKTSLEFIIERHKEAENSYRKSLRDLAKFRDQNKNIISASARIEEEVLQSEYNHNYNLFANISQQLEQARIRVQEETPVFQILEPVSLPFEKAEPKRLKIIIIFFFIGFIISCIIKLFQTYFKPDFF
jgi:LPS O-antigen subunit length determinant protein (WzzB/FepE family)